MCISYLTYVIHNAKLILLSRTQMGGQSLKGGRLGWAKGGKMGLQGVFFTAYDDG